MANYVFVDPNLEVVPPAAETAMPVVEPDARVATAPGEHLRQVPRVTPRIDHSNDLPDFFRKLYDEVELRPSLKHRICPVAISDEDQPKHFAVILLEEELGTDVTRAVVSALAKKGWMLAPEKPFYIAPPSVMVELARDTINEHQRNSKGGPNIKKEDSPLWALFNRVAVFALKFEASDIHIVINHSKATSQIKFRVDGRLTKPREFEFETTKMLDMVAYIYNCHSNTGSENTFNENQAQQCQVVARIDGQLVQFRWASNRTAVGAKVVMRVIPQQETSAKVRTLEELGYLPPQVMKWRRAISRLGGGMLIAGVVGSGKSTTGVTVMSMLPEWMAKYTIEDPVEQLIHDADQFSISRALNDEGSDPFLAVKRQTKRMDPNAVYIGEIRDRESASLFRDIAESGHRALSTVHAPSAIDMITLRLVSAELGIPRDVIATPNFINLLVYQALVPKLCSCNVAATEKYSDEYLSRIERLFDIDRSRIRAENHDGCPKCIRESLPELNGTKGRVLVAEMIEPTPEMLLLFRDSKNLELKEYIRSMRTARFDEPDTDGKSALEVAMYHVAHGTIDPKEVELKFGFFDQYEAEIAGSRPRSRRATGAAPRLKHGFALKGRGQRRAGNRAY